MDHKLQQALGNRWNLHPARSAYQRYDQTRARPRRVRLELLSWGVCDRFNATYPASGTASGGKATPRVPSYRQPVRERRPRVRGGGIRDPIRGRTCGTQGLATEDSSDPGWVFHEPGADGAGFEGCLYHYADGAMSSEDGTVHEYAASGAVLDATPEPEAEPEREPEPESESSKIPAFVEYTPSDVRSYLLATVFVLAAVASVLTLFVSAPDANTAGFVVAAGLAILALAAWSGLAGRNPRSYRSAKVPSRWPAVHAYTLSTCATPGPARSSARSPAPPAGRPFSGDRTVAPPSSVRNR